MLCIQRVVAFTICWFLWLVWFVCVSLDQVEYRALTRARSVHLYAYGQLRPWPYYTHRAAPIHRSNLLQHDRGHRQPKLQPCMFGRISVTHRPHIPGRWSCAGLSGAAVRWASAELVAQHIGGAQQWVKEYYTPSVHEWLLNIETSETMTKSDDWSVVLVFYLAIAMIRDCEPHLSHNNILNALER